MRRGPRDTCPCSSFLRLSARTSPFPQSRSHRPVTTRATTECSEPSGTISVSVLGEGLEDTVWA